MLSVHERAVLPGGGCAGPHYDDTLLPALTEAGFADLRADWHPSKAAHALHVRAVNPQPKPAGG